MVHGRNIHSTVGYPDGSVRADLSDRVAERHVQGAVDEGREGRLEETSRHRERIHVVSRYN